MTTDETTSTAMLDRLHLYLEIREGTREEKQEAALKKITTMERDHFEIERLNEVVFDLKKENTRLLHEVKHLQLKISVPWIKEYGDE